MTSFKAQADASVFGLALIGSTVYAGGNFTTINSTARTRLAAVNATTGALVTGWTPSADDEVTSLAAATDGSKVFVGGLFSHIGSSSQNHVAALNPSTGATLSWAYHPSYPVEGMTATSSSLFLAGGGSGGRVGALSASSGALQWEIAFFFLFCVPPSFSPLPLCAFPSPSPSFPPLPLPPPPPSPHSLLLSLPLPPYLLSNPLSHNFLFFFSFFSLFPPHPSPFLPPLFFSFDVAVDGDLPLERAARRAERADPSAAAAAGKEQA